MNEKKHAFLIMAHNNIEQLNLLLNVLDSDVCDIYLHIDCKSDIQISDINKMKKSKMYIYKEISVFWADYSQIICELFLLEKAIQGDYCYFHLLSGSDLPLKSPEKIAEILEMKNDIFLHFTTVEHLNKALDFVKYYHPFQKQLSSVNRRKKISVIKVVNKLFLQIQKMLKINRIPDGLMVKKGANWFSIPKDVAEYIISKKDWINDRFYNTRSSDEFFIQTLLYNSEFKNRIYMLNEDDDYRSCLRLIDWNRGTPYVFRDEDFDMLINSEMLFARKFDWNVDKKIIKRICSFLLEKKNI